MTLIPSPLCRLSVRHRHQRTVTDPFFSVSFRSLSVSMPIYIAHYRKVSIMCSGHIILLKQMRLQQATGAGDAEIWIAQIVTECVPDVRNHGECTTAVCIDLYSWHYEWAAACRTYTCQHVDFQQLRSNGLCRLCNTQKPTGVVVVVFSYLEITDFSTTTS